MTLGIAILQTIVLIFLLSLGAGFEALTVIPLTFCWLRISVDNRRDNDSTIPHHGVVVRLAGASLITLPSSSFFISPAQPTKSAKKTYVCNRFIELAKIYVRARVKDRETLLAFAKESKKTSAGNEDFSIDVTDANQTCFSFRDLNLGDYLAETT